MQGPMSWLCVPFAQNRCLRNSREFCAYGSVFHGLAKNCGFCACVLHVTRHSMLTRLAQNSAVSRAMKSGPGLCLKTSIEEFFWFNSTATSSYKLQSRPKCLGHPFPKLYKTTINIVSPLVALYLLSKATFVLKQLFEKGAQVSASCNSVVKPEFESDAVNCSATTLCE